MTRRQYFLDEMEKLVPWWRLRTAIEPYYPKGERGRPPIGLERMLRIYFLQQRYSLSDEGLEDALYDGIAMRAFAGIDPAVENVPDASTLLKFRRLLLEHDLTRKLFDEIGISLCERGLMMKEDMHGRCDDHRSITIDQEHREVSRPDMHQTKKGNEWHFGMKAHIGVDADSGQSVRVGESGDRAKPATVDSWERSVMRVRNARNDAHPRVGLLRMGGAWTLHPAIPGRCR
ncbi:IS5 family transposase [Burkholderia cepacia]|uniref:IS5 family transposase n=1 Tax=Burkholderia cepacia TaxID=292 RepID=UPI001CF3112A|nr:IS5 family transposase [Burkholderia cepacia]MCA8119051.1 IS5 family transposase [Burkholderia cepacia]